MEFELDWSISIDPELRRLFESQIRSDLGNHSPFSPCHKGIAMVSVASSDPFGETVEGNIKCKCGVQLGTLEGISNGSKMTYFAFV